MVGHLHADLMDFPGALPGSGCLPSHIRDHTSVAACDVFEPEGKAPPLVGDVLGDLGWEAP